MNKQLQFELDAQQAVRKEDSYMVDWWGRRAYKAEGLEIWIADPSWESPGDEEEVIGDCSEAEELERLKKWNDAARGAE